MDTVVLIKAVPALDSLEFDPERRTVRRERGPLFLNPFDQRALRVALDLRRPAERVTVVSLGPLAARAPLREAKAAGADRVVLLSDPVFAGSDTIATVSALRAAIELLRPALVLAGAWSTDSETGQVGPELAARLDWPILAEARALRRLDHPDSIEVTVDTGDGWARYRGSAPGVLTVGEKIAKPPKPTAEAIAAVDPGSIEVWSAADIGVDPAQVGFSGSLTSVAAVTFAAPARAPVVFARGSAADRVGGAIEVLTRHLSSPRPPVAPLPPPPVRRIADREQLVLVTGRNGRLDPAVLGTFSALRRAVPEGWTSALWIGSEPSAEETAALERAGSLAGYLVRSRERPIDPVAAARVAEELLVRRPELAVLACGAGPFGRVVAGTVAGRRRLGLVGDALDLSVDIGGALRWLKPSFGGRTLAEIRCRSRPNLVTFRSGSLRPAESPLPARIEWNELSIPVPPSAWRPIDDGVEIPPGEPLEARDVIVAVGMGIGGPEGIARAGPVLARWGAGLAATRRVVDAGWVARQLQVGLTGRTLAPRLAVLLGLSGAVNHTVGWQRAGTIVAVNRDPDAPVFRDVDVGIVGTVEEILPALEGPVAALLGR